MGTIIDFLIENFMYVIFVVILLILALIGYIVDSSKTKKMDNTIKQIENKKNEIPVSNLNSSIQLGETVNQIPTNSNPSVNTDQNVKPVKSVDEVLKL